MYVYYWFILKFTYSVYFLLYRQCLCLLVLLNIQIPVQETASNINPIISQSHFQTPQIMLAVIQHQDTAVTRMPPVEILPMFVFARCILFIVYLPVTAQHLCPNFNCIYKSYFYFILNFWFFSSVQEKLCHIKCNRNNSIVLQNEYSAGRKQNQKSFDKNSSLSF